MLFSENNQEAYDNLLMAHRIAENENVRLPLMVCQDGFITSHSIENIELETYYSDYFKCDLPVIPDNGNLIEAIASYCMYKMLLRGYKHPVLTLQGNNPAINPYVNWISLKPKVKTSIVLDKQLDISNTNAWRSYFYNFTFMPKS